MKAHCPQALGIKCLVVAMFAIALAEAQSLQEELFNNGSDVALKSGHGNETDVVPQVPLLSSPQFNKFLQKYLQVFAKRLNDVTVPVDQVQGSQIPLAWMQKISLLQTTKELFTQDDIRIFVPKPEAVHQRCYDDVMDFLDALIGERQDALSTDYATTKWAFQMFDAFGKPGGGLLRGTLQWVGNYDECLDLHAHIPAGTYLGSRATPRNESTEFDAQYCRVQILLPGLEASAVEKHSEFWKQREETPTLVHWGMCFPESCTSHDVDHLLTEGTMTAVPLHVENVICFERDPDLGSDAGAIFAVCLLSLMGAIILGCTALETAIHHGYITMAECQGQCYSSDTVRIVQISGDPKDQVNNRGQDKGNEHVRGQKPNYKTPLKTDNWPRDVIQDDCNLEKNDAGAGKDKGVDKTSVGLRLLQAFSLRHNASKLVTTTTTQDPGMFGSIQGLRVISISWIVLGHTYTVGGSMDARNYVFAILSKVPENVERKSFTIILAANLAVDTFFVISGALVMAMTLRELRKGKGQSIGFWIMFYIHRIWRLTPVYMMVLMTGTTLYDYIVEGPLKSDPYLMFEHCPSHWWTNLLYINNFAYPNKECMFWTWYLAVDMQLFVISPIFIVLIHRHYRWGFLAMIATIILGTIATFLITFYNTGIILTMTTTNTEYWEYVYRVPWSRLAVFTVGLLVGVILEDLEDKPQWSKMKTGLVWLVSSAIAIFIIAIPHDELKEGADYWPKGTQALYEASSRLGWSLFIGWVIYACQSGLGGVLTRILTWTGFQPLARLTYTVYLVHPMVITFFIYSGHFPIDMEDSVIIYRFLGNLILSYLIGALFSLSFESPFMGLEKIILRRH